MGLYQKSDRDDAERIFSRGWRYPEHIHLAGSFYPPFEIDRWIGEIKGASSHEFSKALQWQSGYGVVSFGTKDLEWVVAYIRNQKERHQSGRLSDRLERINDD